MAKRFLRPWIAGALVYVTVTLGLAGCKTSTPVNYPAYSVMVNKELNIVELNRDGVVFRPYGVMPDNTHRGAQIGSREGEPQSKICEVKGYPSSEWIIEYLDEFMGGGDMLYKATGITDIPADLEQYKQYEQLRLRFALLIIRRELCMEPEIRLGNVMIDCKNPGKLRDFYAELLYWEKCELYNLPAVRNSCGIVLLFCGEDDYIAPVWPETEGKQQKQMHLDFQTYDVPGMVRRAEALGAVKAVSQFGGDDFVTMIDPAGHPFCLCLAES